MQTASTNICERIGGSQELSEFQRSTVIGWHLKISLLLKIENSAVSSITLSFMWPSDELKDSVLMAEFTAVVFHHCLRSVVMLLFQGELNVTL